jgi:hypothetical protein
VGGDLADGVKRGVQMSFTTSVISWVRMLRMLIFRDGGGNLLSFFFAPLSLLFSCARASTSDLFWSPVRLTYLAALLVRSHTSDEPMTTFSAVIRSLSFFFSFFFWKLQWQYDDDRHAYLWSKVRTYTCCCTHFLSFAFSSVRFTRAHLLLSLGKKHMTDGRTYVLCWTAVPQVQRFWGVVRKPSASFFCLKKELPFQARTLDRGFFFEKKIK